MPRIAWENNILGFIPKTDWLDIPFRVERPNDPVDQLLGDQKTENLVAEWESIAQQYQIPMMAQFHGFDTESQTTFRVPIDNHNIEKGLIKVKINQSERMRTLLRSGVQNDDMYDFVINDGVRLADQVVTRTKVAKNELLATGKITIKENDLDLNVDYGVPAANLEHTLDFGAGATSDIIDQLQTLVDAATDQGVILTGIYASRKAVNKLRSNKSIQVAINGVYSEGIRVSQSALEDFLSDEYGITEIITNDLTYGASATIGEDNRPNIVQRRYYPINKMTFFARTAGGKMGIGLWGDPPETDVTQLLDVASSGRSPYVYVTQWAENDPAVLWTKASSLFMPVLYNPNSIYIASVIETPGA